MKALKDILEFLTELSENNNREWFNENKAHFQELRLQFEDIVQQFIDELGKNSSSIANQKAKDCIFRIYKDVRFSKDKSPYKTSFSAHISEGGRKGDLCGHYLHIEPNNTMLAGGTWSPPSNILYEIRDAIYADNEDFKKIIEAKSFETNFGQLEGAKLKNGPKGFPKDFEDIELLKYKSFLAMHPMTNEEVLSDTFFDHSIKVFKHMEPLNNFINRAIKHME